MEGRQVGRKKANAAEIFKMLRKLNDAEFSVLCELLGTDGIDNMLNLLTPELIEQACEKDKPKPKKKRSHAAMSDDDHDFMRWYNEQYKYVERTMAAGDITYLDVVPPALEDDPGSDEAIMADFKKLAMVRNDSQTLANTINIVVFAAKESSSPMPRKLVAKLRTTDPARARSLAIFLSGGPTPIVSHSMVRRYVSYYNDLRRYPAIIYMPCSWCTYTTKYASKFRDYVSRDPEHASFWKRIGKEKKRIRLANVSLQPTVAMVHQEMNHEQWKEFDKNLKSGAHPTIKGVNLLQQDEEDRTKEEQVAQEADEEESESQADNFTKFAFEGEPDAAPLPDDESVPPLVSQREKVKHEEEEEEGEEPEGRPAQPASPMQSLTAGLDAISVHSPPSSPQITREEAAPGTRPEDPMMVRRRAMERHGLQQELVDKMFFSDGSYKY
ncbi:hypothetical protein QOT17_001528 [Balamuthia mandrillaris]